MHERVLDRFERLWQIGDKRLGIGLVSDDHIFAIDEAVGTGPVACARRGHRRQLEDVFLAHVRLASLVKHARTHEP
jgi:hypothetical protein